MALLRELAELGGAATALTQQVVPLEQLVQRVRDAAPDRSPRVFCPIWKRPWMAVGADTYADDLLRLCGGRNVFRERRERRYPIVETSDIVAAAPEVILLPDEPYAFGPRDVAERGGYCPEFGRCWSGRLRFSVSGFQVSASTPPAKALGS